MSKRSITTIRRPDPHEPEPDPDAPGCCKRCHLVDGAGVHSAKAIAEHAAAKAAQEAQIHWAQEAHRRRTGEHE